MSYLGHIVDKAKGLLSRERPSGTETVAVDHDRFDHADWTGVMQTSQPLQQVMGDLGETFDYVEDLGEGIFDYFVKAEPEIRDAANMRDSHKPNQTITMQAKETPQVTQLRQYSKSDPYTAAMAVIGVSEKLREYLKDNKELAEQAEQAQKEREEREKAEQALADAMQQAQAADSDYDGEGPSTQEQADAAAALQAAMDALSQAQAAEDAAGQQLQQAMDNAAPATRTAVSEAIEEAAEEAAEQAAAMTAAGVDPGEAKRMPFEQRKELAQALAASKLREIAKWIGRARIEARAEQSRRVEHGRDQFVDVELGKDLSRVLTPELMKLSSSAPRGMRIDAMVRLSNGRLMQRRYEGKEKQGRGPILAVVDTSGSMGASISMSADEMQKANLDEEMSREAMAKAITFVLLDSAKRQKRDFYCILFSSAGEQRHYDFPAHSKPRVLDRDGTTEIQVEPIAGNPELAVVVDLITFAFDGGTNFEQPLEQAIDVIESRFNGNGRPKADLAFITDDDGRVSPAFMERYLALKHRIGFRTFGFAVGCHSGMSLDALCSVQGDNVRSLTDITSGFDDVRDVFRTV